MPIPFAQQEPLTPEQDAQSTPSMNTRSDALEASFSASYESNPLQKLKYLDKLGQADASPDQPTIGVDDLNKQYPGMAWNEPKKASVAKLMWQDHLDKYNLQQRISGAPQDTTQKALGFGAGVVAGMLDPINILTFEAGGAALKGAGLVAKGGMAAEAINAGAGGIAGQLPLEGFKAATDAQEGKDFSAGEFGTDIATAGIAGVGIHAALGGLKFAGAKAWESARGRLGTIPEGVDVPHMQDVHQSSIPDVADHPAVQESLKAQLEDGRSPNIKPFEDVHAQERTGPWNDPPLDTSGRSKYQFEPIDTEKPVTGKFYVGTDSHVEVPGNVDLSSHPNAMAENDFGHGTTMVDDARAANGFAASSFNDSPGVIHEVNLADAKLLSADAAIPEDARAAMEKAAGIEIKPETPLRDVYNQLKEEPHGTVDGVNQALREAGYDGVHFEQASTDGASAHNGVTLFPGAEDKLTHAQAIQSDPSLLKGPSEAAKSDMIASHDDPASQVGYDPREQKAIQESSKTLKEDAKADLSNMLAEHAAAAEADLKNLKEQGVLSDASEKAWSAIKDGVDKLQKTGSDIVEFFSNCLGAH